MNPGPHGPEIKAGSSTETDFEGFELVSCARWTIWGSLIHRARLDYYTNYYMGIYCWYRSFADYSQGLTVLPVWRSQCLSVS